MLSHYLLLIIVDATKSSEEALEERSTHCLSVFRFKVPSPRVNNSNFSDFSTHSW